MSPQEGGMKPKRHCGIPNTHLASLGGKEKQSLLLLTVREIKVQLQPRTPPASLHTLSTWLLPVSWSIAQYLPLPPWEKQTSPAHWSCSCNLLWLHGGWGLNCALDFRFGCETCPWDEWI